MIRITAGLKTSDYWCLVRGPLRLRTRGSGSVAVLDEIRGPCPVRRAKAIPDLAAGSPPPDDLRRDPPAKEPAGAATPTVVAPKPRRSLVLPIVVGDRFWPSPPWPWSDFSSRSRRVQSRLAHRRKRLRRPCRRWRLRLLLWRPLSNSPDADDRARGAPCKARSRRRSKSAFLRRTGSRSCRRRIRALLSN